MSYTPNAELMNEFQVTLISYGCTETPEDMINKIVNTIPAEIRGNFDEDDLKAAMAYASTYFGDLSGAGSMGAAPSAVQAQADAAQPAVLTTQQTKVISDLVKANAAEKAARTAKTSIAKILFDKPYAKDYLDPSMTVIPRCTKAKLDEYRAKLVQDEANIAAFNEIAAACDTEGTGQGTPMPINISDSLKTLGYTIVTPSTEAGSETMETLHMPTKQLMGFVASKLSGLIPTATPEDLGCKLTWNRKRNKGAKAQVGATSGTPRLRVVGRKGALENPDKHDFTSVATAATKKGKLRIEKTFQILTGGTNAKGEPKTRTIRLSGDAMIPVFERKNPEYAKAFPMVTKSGGIDLLSGKEAAKMQALQADIVSFIVAQGGEAYDYGLEGVAEQINNDLAKGATAGVQL